MVFAVVKILDSIKNRYCSLTKFLSYCSSLVGVTASTGEIEDLKHLAAVQI